MALNPLHTNTFSNWLRKYTFPPTEIYVSVKGNIRFHWWKYTFPFGQKVEIYISPQEIYVSAANFVKITKRKICR